MPKQWQLYKKRKNKSLPSYTSLFFGYKGLFFAKGKSKKGYFFIVDAIVALSILAIGLVMIFSFYKIEPSVEQSQFFSTELADTLAKTRIIDVNNEYAGANSILTQNRNITNIHNTIIEQIAEFYYRYKEKGCSFCLGLAANFTKEITGDISTTGLSYSISIDNYPIYNYTVLNINDSMVVLPSRFIVHGLYNKKELYGPYVVEVLSWY